MRTARFKSIVVAAALVLLAALGLGLAEESFLHTDDGCAVEIHCLACRFALSATVVTPARLTIEPVLAASGWVTAGPLTLFVAPSPRRSLSRGPPIAPAPLS